MTKLPNGVSADKPKTNEEAAAFIKSFTRRPGARAKQLSERPEVAPPDHSAVQRHHGRLPRVAFPLLVKLSKQRRGRHFTNCGNRVWPLANTALVERQRLVDWVERQCCCRRCNRRLRLSKSTSHQVGVCARVHFVCEGSCARLKPLETSAPMHGDDYQLNSLLNYAITACAISFEHLSSPSAAPTVRPVRSRGRERGVCAGSSAGPLPRIVKPLYGLRSPYRLVDEQRQKRRPPPKRQLKWTPARLGAAAAAIARGEQPGPLRCSAPPEAASRDGVGDSLMAEASESDDWDGEWACD